MLKKYLSFVFLLGMFLFISCKDKSTEPTEPTDYTNADGILGGILYDSFWATEANYSKASDQNLVNKLKTYSDFFRCKQCHGWDLLGTNGAYINRGPKTNRPNISSVNLSTIVKTKTPQELFDAIKKTTGRRDINYDLSTYNPSTNASIGDQMPNFSQLLSDKEIWALVKFLKNEVINVSDLYDFQLTGTYPTGKISYSNIGKDGNAANGKTYFTQKCQVCHGPDGKLIPDLDKTPGLTLGKFIRTKPNEAQHKIKFGQLGSPMIALKTSLQDMKNLYKAATDTLTFPNK
jgi:thiosulfate dehydrogenase